MNKDNRNDVLNIIIGVVEDIYGSQPSYEMLTAKLNTEFPEMQFTLSEVIEYYSLSMEQEELQILFNNLHYDWKGNTDIR